MRAFLVISLMLLVLIQSFSRWIIMAEFEANRQWIAKNLCENRSRPQLKCGGKCQLMKRLAQDDRAAAPGSGKVRFEETAWPDGTVFFEPHLTAGVATLAHHERYLRFVPEANLAAPFRPPGLVTLSKRNLFPHFKSRS